MLEQVRGIGIAGAVGRLAYEQRTLEQLDGHILARGRLDADVAPPREKPIDPRHHLILVPADRLDDKPRRPPIGPRRDEGHRRLVPPTRDLGFGIWDSLRDSLWDSLWDSLRDSLRDSL